MPTDGKPKNGIVRQLFSYGGVSAMQTFVEFGVFAVLQLAGLPFRGRLLLRLIQLRHEPQRHIQILVELRAFDSHVRGHVLLEPAVLQPDDGLDPRTARLAHHGGQDRHNGHAGGLGLPAVPLRHLQMTFAPDGFPAAITGKRTCYLTMDAHRETCG